MTQIEKYELINYVSAIVEYTATWQWWSENPRDSSLAEGQLSLKEKEMKEKYPLE